MRIKTIFVLTLAVVATTVGCSAKVPDGKSTSHPIVATDTIMHKAVGDSIYRIIMNAKKVQITALPLPSDSLKQTITKKVPAKEIELIKFIATNPKNYMTDTVVYGVFMPQIQATYWQKKANVTLKYDFGLRKWGIFNADDKPIAMFDLASDNMLRFACKIFSGNHFLHELLLTRE